MRTFRNKKNGMLVQTGPEGLPTTTVDENFNLVSVTKADYEELDASAMSKVTSALDEIAVKRALAAELDAKIKSLFIDSLLNSGELTVEELGAADYGFVNLHTSDSLDGKGDGKWYPFGGGKTRHTGDTTMSRDEARARGLEIGE